MKTEFKCELGNGDEVAGHSIELKIIGSKPRYSPYVAVYAKTSTKTTQAQGWISDRDLERFAVNILKALKSKRLK